MSKKVVTFGEIMLRLSPLNFQRFIQARSFDAIYGGAEANVAISLASFRHPSEFITRLPNNELGDACLNYIRQFGVGCKNIIRGGERLGIYFLEPGVVHRNIKVIYDRKNSSISTIKPGMVNWSSVFVDKNWFHWTGITPALSKGAASTCLEAVKIAKKSGITVSCDLNYRNQLWDWTKNPKEVMSELTKYTDIIVGNTEAIKIFFGIESSISDKSEEDSNQDKYINIGKELMNKFPNLKKIVITIKEQKSASHNFWSAILFDGTTLYRSPIYSIIPIVDRVGGGDALTAGLIYGILKFGRDIKKILDFAVAAHLV